MEWKRNKPKSDPEAVDPWAAAKPKPAAKPRAKPKPKPKAKKKAKKKGTATAKGVTFVSPNNPSLQVNTSEGTVTFVDGRYTTWSDVEVKELSAVAESNPVLIAKEK